MRHAIGQQIIIGLQGLTLTSDEAKFIVDNNIGGVILFKRNVESPEQVRNLCAELQALRHKMPNKAPLFISIDMEGGRVHRLKPPFTQWPALAHVGKIDSTSVAFRFAQAMGDELRAVGINLDYAPSIDIFNNPQNTVIGDRALSTKADVVAKLGSALVRGYLKADIIACAKHFPGHGHTLVDSHVGLPVEEKTLEELDAEELEPFKKVFRARLDLVMVAHIMFPKIDPDWPVSLSEIFIQKILREQMRYRQLVISDDLDMGALKNNWDKATIATRALQAGNNILLYCNEPDSPHIALDAVEKAVTDGTLSKDTVEENAKKVLALKADRLTHPDPLPMEEVIKIIA
ncbi:MAG: beta-N-acetylhexosaminidase, partial [Proteobacteria bacterium]